MPRPPQTPSSPRRSASRRALPAAAPERHYVEFDDLEPDRHEAGGEASAVRRAPARESAAAVPAGDVPLEEIFGHGGLLSRCQPGFEFRASQLEMAQAVEEAFRLKRQLMVEAGTGTGKTLAYLIPAIRSGRRVVVSTATKSLQEQLYQKDIPFLQRHFAPSLKVAVMKGRGNFLCRQKLRMMAGQPLLKAIDEVEWFGQIVEWEKLTETGDRAELTILPDENDLWPRLDARRETCTGQKCPEFRSCFLTRMHQRAQEADVIIVNHHLFFADLALRQDDFGSVLPDYSAVIFDEAHEMEDVASDFFGRQVSNFRFEELARDAEHALRLRRLPAPQVHRRANQVREKSRSFFDLFQAREGRFPFEAAARAAFLEQHREAYDELHAAVKRLETEIAALPERPDELIAVARRGGELRAEMKSVLEEQEPNFVCWYERRGKGVFLSATPIDVSAILREQLFARFDSIVLTSATLAVGGSFDYLRRRLGLDRPQERLLPLEFDYPRQAVLYIPPDLPDVRQPAFVESAAREIARVLEISRGRAFCLFTSYAQMKEVHKRVKRAVKFPLLLQGTSPPPALLEKFRHTRHAVLFATASFWQGVDVPGEQLSCVMVDRLPFAVPTDPVVAARVRWLNENGQNAFGEYQVPQAVLALKQGFGRLIRTRHDRGILVILDNRISRMNYGRTFLNSLPSYAVTGSIEEVRRFFDSGAESDAARSKPQRAG